MGCEKLLINVEARATYHVRLYIVAASTGDRDGVGSRDIVAAIKKFRLVDKEFIQQIKIIGQS